MNNAVLNSTITRAAEILAARSPRARYAQAVLAGKQNWSGSDLRGKARHYSASYARGRRHAARALIDAGGSLAYAGRYGRLVAAVQVGTDDYGNALYQTQIGPAVAGKSRRLQLAAAVR